MIMPFLRLVSIYIVVILAALLVFKRDQVMPLLGLSEDGAETKMAATADQPAEVAEPVAPAPETSATENATEAAPQTMAPTKSEQLSKYPTETTAQVGTPADPAQAPAPSAQSQSSQTPAADIQSRLTQARQTYWNRDLVKAETLYKSLVSEAPTNADIKGELGNLYFSQRRMVEAAEMYHQTGLQLISNGNTQQIMSLIGVLQSIAPDKAADLRNRLSQ